MTRAVTLLCDTLLDEGVERLELRTHPGNEPSQQLAVRCGFHREGTERKSIWLHGRRADAIVWSRLPEDRSVTVHSLRTRTLLVMPIRIVLGLVWLVGCPLGAGSGSGPALLAFAIGALGIAFLIFNDPRSRFLHGDVEPLELPAGRARRRHAGGRR